MRDKSFIKNQHGTAIVMCCASCRFNKGISNSTKERRICGLDSDEVLPFQLCSQWEMNPVLNNAGNGDGRVKRKEYIKFVAENAGRYSIHEIREEFEKKHGSRFLF